LLLGIGATLLACLIADGFWFYLGRKRGNQVLNFLCRVSLEPDSCVRRTQNVFTRYGMKGVVVAKFVTGMSTVAPPLAGMSGVRAGKFFFFDGLGAFLYGASILGVGYLFSNQIEQIAEAISSVGGSALTLLAVIVVSYIAYKYWQRHRLLRELRTARITVEELRKKLDAGENPVILDLRSKAEFDQNPALIEGAIHLAVDEIQVRSREFPRDREIVVYCNCPNEVTAARVALLLQRNGFRHVRPLLGGYDAWRDGKHPMQARRESIISPAP
jgi:membrane protein DedA with SNARE-associated domain/rhodanese-related sulfurtransferase